MPHHETQSPQPSEILKNNIDLLAIEVLNRNEGLDGSTHFVKKDEVFSTAVHKRENSADIDSPFVETDTDEIIEELGSNLAYLQEQGLGEVKDTLESLENRGLSFKDGQRDALLGRAALGFKSSSSEQANSAVTRSNEWAAPTLVSWEAPKTDEVILSTDVATYIQNNFITEVATQALSSGENVTLPVIKKEAFEGLIALIKQETDPNDTELLQRKISEAKAFTSNYFEQAINEYTTNKIATAFDSLGLQVEPASPTELQAPSGAPVSLDAPAAHPETATSTGNEIYVTQELRDTFETSLRSLYEKSNVQSMFTGKVAEDREGNLIRIPNADFAVIAKQVRNGLLEAVRAESTDAGGTIDQSKYDAIVGAFDREVEAINRNQTAAYEQALKEEHSGRVVISQELSDVYNTKLRSKYVDADPSVVVTGEKSFDDEGNVIAHFFHPKFAREVHDAREEIVAFAKAEYTDTDGNFDQVSFDLVIDAFDRDSIALRASLIRQYEANVTKDAAKPGFGAPEGPMHDEPFAVSEELQSFYTENVRSILNGKDLLGSDGFWTEEVDALMHTSKVKLVAKVIAECEEADGSFDNDQVNRIMNHFEQDLLNRRTEILDAINKQTETPTTIKPVTTIRIPSSGDIIDATSHSVAPEPLPESTPGSAEVTEKDLKEKLAKRVTEYAVGFNERVIEAGKDDDFNFKVDLMLDDFEASLKLFKDATGSKKGFLLTGQGQMFNSIAELILEEERGRVTINAFNRKFQTRKDQKRVNQVIGQMRNMVDDRTIAEKAVDQA